MKLPTESPHGKEDFAYEKFLVNYAHAIELLDDAEKLATEIEEQKGADPSLAKRRELGQKCTELTAEIRASYDLALNLSAGEIARGDHGRDSAHFDPMFEVLKLRFETVTKRLSKGLQYLTSTPIYAEPPAQANRATKKIDAAIQRKRAELDTIEATLATHINLTPSEEQPTDDSEIKELRSRREKLEEELASTEKLRPHAKILDNPNYRVGPLN